MKTTTVRQVAQRARDLIAPKLRRDPILRETVQAVSQALAQRDIEVRVTCKSEEEFELMVRSVRQSLQTMDALGRPLERMIQGVNFELRNGSAIFVTVLSELLAQRVLRMSAEEIFKFMVPIFPISDAQ